jgi:phosphoribosylformylglycinamidine synthase
LADALGAFHADEKLILGICNGFQVLLQTGLILAGDERGPLATLAWNNSGRFEDRWVKLRVVGGKSVFLNGLEAFELPVAHAEGRFVVRDEASLARLDQSGRLVLRYCSNDQGSEPPAYPDNPNGSMADVAGVMDESGRVLGLMPHPERHVRPTQHPRWTREPAEAPGAGLRVFHNAVSYFL